LLSELQHRVKNSFTLISSMIEIAAEKSNTSTENKISFGDLASRINAVSELYSMLYSNGIFTDLWLDDYCIRIAEALTGLSKNVSLVTNLEHFLVLVDKAGPIGLILTELITNAIKYAFPNDRDGIITISLGKSGESVFLEVKDNGIGLPDSIDISKGDSIGFSLVKALTDQIKGRFIMESNTEGTSCVIEFAQS